MIAHHVLQLLCTTCSPLRDSAMVMELLWIASNNDTKCNTSSDLRTIKGDDISGKSSVSVRGHLDLLNNQETSVDKREEMTDISLQEDQTVIPTSIGNPTKNMSSYKGDTKILERQFLIKSGVMSGTVTGITVEPWVDLLNLPSLTGYLQRFRYIRAGIKVTIVLDTVPSLYGYVALLPLYSYGYTGNYETRDLYSAPGLVLMDVASRDSVEIHLPYRLPVDWVDTKEPIVNTHFPRLAFFDGEVLSTSSTTAPTISYKVYANFEDVTVSGPIAIAQSGYMDYVNTASAGLTVADKLVTQASRLASRIYEFMPDDPEVMDEEDKDTVVEPLRMTSYGNMSSCAGQSNIPSLTLSKFNPASGMLTEKAEDLSWKRLLKIQNFHSSYSLTDSDLVIFNDKWIYADGGWMNVVIDSHRLFRGSTKWSLHFFTSPLVSTRLQISVGWFGANGLPGDMYTDIVTIQGSSVHTYQIPYIFPKHWRHSRNINEFTYNMNVSVISPVTSLGDSVPIVKMLAFYSGADDFIVRGFQSQKRAGIAQMDVTALHSKDFKPVLDVDTSVVDEWETTSVYDALKRFSQRADRNWKLQGSLVDRFPVDTYDYWVSYACRYVRGNLRIKTTLTPGKVYKIAMQPTGVFTSGDRIYHAGDGVLLQDANVWPIAEFEVPYMSSYVMVNSCPDWQPGWTDDGLIFADALTEPSFKTYAAIGPNFGLHILLPPVPREVRLGIETGN